MNQFARLNQFILILSLCGGMFWCSCHQPVISSKSPSGGDMTISWKYGANLPAPNGSFVASILGKDIILAGGTNWQTGSKQWLKAVHIYNPATDTWKYKMDLPRPTAYATVSS